MGSSEPSPGSLPGLFLASSVFSTGMDGLRPCQCQRYLHDCIFYVFCVLRFLWRIPVNDSVKPKTGHLLGSLAHVSLQTTDLRQAHLFYVDVLELDLLEASESDFTVDLFGVPFMVSAGGRPGARSGFTIAFCVNDFEATFSELARRGITFVQDRREVLPGTWAAAFLDPDGNRIEIISATPSS